MKYSKILGHSFFDLLFYFTAYSFIGWMIETLYVSIYTGKFVNRGFLYGPFIPVYGFGALLLIVLLQPFSRNLIMFFCGSILLTSVLEYITGFLMENLFGVKLWDYSSQPLNLQGRICLRNSIYWGVGAVVIVHTFQDHIRAVLDRVPKRLSAVLSFIVLFYFITDLSFSTAFVLRTNDNSYLLNITSKINSLIGYFVK